MKLYQEIMDDLQGYSLSEDPVARAKQLALHEYALQEETTILGVVESSSDARHRAIAAHALGYAGQSDRQIAALAQASLRPPEIEESG